MRDLYEWEAIEREIDEATDERLAAIQQYTDAEFRLKEANRRLGRALEQRAALRSQTAGEP